MNVLQRSLHTLKAFWLFIQQRLAKITKKTTSDAVVHSVAQHHEQQAVLRHTSKRIPTPQQLRYAWRLFSTLEKRVIITALCASILFALSFAGVYSYNRTAVLPAVGGMYSEGLLSTPQFLNPVLAFDNDTDVSMNRLIFAGLLRYNTNLELVPDLAESYSISEDQKTYTFTLRDNLTWHDDTNLTADDILFTIETIKNPQYNSPQYGRFRDVNVAKIDDKTISFTLSEPFAGFLAYLTVGIIPEHIWGSITPANSRLADANTKPIGAGPYKFSKLQKETDGRVISYTLESFENYHDHQPFIKTIQFRFYPDLQQAVEALQRQTINGLEFLPQGNRIELSQLKTVNLHTFSLPQYTALFFNQLQNDQLASQAVRKALTHAIDKQALVQEIFADQATPINSPVLPGSVGYYPDIKTYEYNPEEATKLLTDAGWTRNEETGYMTKDGTPLSITITTVDIADTMVVAEFIQNAWQQIGVATELQIIPRQYVERDILSSRNYQALLFGEVLGPDQDQFPFWHSSKRQHPGVNLTSFADTKADSLLENARATTDQEQRTKIYQEFQDILLEAVPAIFLYSPLYTYPVDEQIQGIAQTKINTSADRFNGIVNWYIRTERQWKN